MGLSDQTAYVPNSAVWPDDFYKLGLSLNYVGISIICKMTSIDATTLAKEYENNL